MSSLSSACGRLSWARHVAGSLGRNSMSAPPLNEIRCQEAKSRGCRKLLLLSFMVAQVWKRKFDTRRCKLTDRWARFDLLVRERVLGAKQSVSGSEEASN